MSQEYEAIGVYDDDGEAPEASFEHQSESLPFDDKRALRNVLVNGASFTVLSMCLSPSLVLQPVMHYLPKTGSPGILGLALLFGTFALSSQAMPFMIDFFTERFVMLIGCAFIMPFVLVNYSGLESTGLVALFCILAVLAGFGCAAVFVGRAVYLTRNTKMSEMGRNFGIFFASIHLGELIGNMIASGFSRKLLDHQNFLNHAALRNLFPVLMISVPLYFISLSQWKKPVIGPRGPCQRPPRCPRPSVVKAVMMTVLPLLILALFSGYLQGISILSMARMLGRGVTTLPYHWAVYGAFGIGASLASGFLIDYLELKFFFVALASVAAVIGMYGYYWTNGVLINYGYPVVLAAAQSTWDVLLFTLTAIALSPKAEVAFAAIYFIRSLFTTFVVGVRAENMISVGIIGGVAVLSALPLFFFRKNFDRNTATQAVELE